MIWKMSIRSSADESPSGGVSPRRQPSAACRRSRTNRSLRSCLCCFRSRHGGFLLLFNILTVALQVTGAEEEWGLKVSRSSHDGEGFSTEDIAYVSSLVGVKQMRPVYEPDGYILLPESPEEVETPLRIRPYSGLGAAFRRFQV